MKSVVLTGGSRGIGAAILRELLAQQKYKIYLIGRMAPNLSTSDQNFVNFYESDLCDPEAILTTCRAIRADAKRVNIIINNAGIGLFKPVEKIDQEEWTRVLNINLLAPFLLIREFIAEMKEDNHGRIVNISSDADHIGFAGAGAYCASKYGLRGLSDAIRQELVGTNVSVTTIAPGRVDTCFNNKQPGDRPHSLAASDVARQVLHVISSSGRCHIETIRLKSTLE